MTTPTEVDWLALCLASETNQPHEAQYVAWAIRNRRDSKYRGAQTIVDVILDRKQFSYFNIWTSGTHPVMTRTDVFIDAMRGYAGKVLTANRGVYDDCARAILEMPTWMAPFGPDVLHYWSPVSMKPKGSKPAWAGTGSRAFTPGCVDPRRFVFEAGVR